METLSLFNDDSYVSSDLEIINHFLSSLNNFLSQFIVDKNLPVGSLYIRTNVSKLNGKITSWSVCLHEPYYPAPYGDERIDNYEEVILTFSLYPLKSVCYFELNVKAYYFDKVELLGSPRVSVHKNSDMTFVKYLISDESCLSYIKSLVSYALVHYHSYEDPFGCCSRYLQCSSLKKCIHPNQLFATACMYRKNLIKGNIFFHVDSSLSPAVLAKSILDSCSHVDFLPHDYTVFDVETTGGSYLNNDIIEITCIKYRNHNEVARFHSLVKPNKSIPPYVVYLTHIDDLLVANAPSFSSIADSLFKFLVGEILIGHNVFSDIQFLVYSLIVNLDISLYPDFSKTLVFKYFDTYKTSLRVFPGLVNYKLPTLANIFKLSLPSHRSTDDCLTTYSLYRHIFSTVSQSGKPFKSYLSDVNLPKLSSSVSSKFVNAFPTFSLKSSELDVSNPFYHKNIVITGDLPSYSKPDWYKLLSQLGAYVPKSNVNVSKKTDILIVGDLSHYSNTSAKLKQAESLNSQGFDISILSQSQFFALLSPYVDNI